MTQPSVATHLLDQIASRRGENFDLFRSYVNPAFVRLLGLVGFARRFVSATGFEMVDDIGQRYLDFVSGYGVLNVGHNHPEIKEALRSVLTLDIPGFAQVDCGLLTGLAAERLARLFPRNGEGNAVRVYFCNSGAEAVDSAIKLARAATRHKGILCCEGAYHGTSLGVLGLMDNGARRDRFRPLLPGIHRIPYDDLNALEKALGWGDIAAFVVEPILGEAGAVVPKPDYVRNAVDLCHRYGALLIADEVQTGLGRTGRWFAFEHSQAQPDIVALAKSLSGGMVPVAATVADQRVFDKAYGSLATCLDHRTTFGGGPLAMTAVLATLEVLEREELVARAEAQGGYLRERLDTLQQRHKQIAEIRGMGLMIGIRFRELGLPLPAIMTRFVDKATSALFAQYVALELLRQHRIVTQVAANDTSVLKVMPPLSITREAIDSFVDALDAILRRGDHRAALLSLATALLD